jgi:hypothetical protein
MQWLLDNLDIPGNKFAKIIWDDVNNGCGSSRFSPSEWRAHFYIKHEATATNLEYLLIESYTAYARTIIVK